MLRKIALLSTGLVLAACGSNANENPTQTTFPGEFANADYVLSEENAQNG